MTLDDVKTHALQMAAAYAFLIQDMHKHDVDAHNLCSAVVERGGQTLATFFAYSNLSAIPAKLQQVYCFVDGKVDNKLINRGGMQDLHTEVRLINHLYANGYLVANTVVSFFSSRSCCATCRRAIMETMRLLSGTVALMAYEFKAEAHGSITENVYPIMQDRSASQAVLGYE
jgi:hypothetical protein